MSGTKWLVAIAASVAICVGLAAQDKGIKASNARVRLPASGETQAIVLLTVENPGMYEVNVTSAKSDVAAKVDLRDGTQSVTFINVPPYGRVDMSASGAHLRLIDLKKSLKEGDAVALTLSTDADVTLEVNAVVRAN